MAQDPYRYFRIEARELLDQLAKGILDLEKGADPGILARLLRLAHTLKGAARVVKQPEIANHAHAIEEILAPFRETPSSVPRTGIDGVLGFLDGINSRILGLVPPPDPVVPAANQSRPEEPASVAHAVVEMDALLDGVVEVHVQMGCLRKSLGMVEQAGYLAELLAKQIATPRISRTGGPVVGEKVSVLVEELRTLSGGIERSLAAGIEQLERELAEVRDLTERLRLIPTDPLLTSLERTVRDVAQTLGKRVCFTGRGGDVRIDAQMLGTIQGALLQVVRNAVAHGIESESERTAAGKPAEGHVTIDVARRGRHIVFTGTDDGRGVDIEAVRRAAQRKGLRQADVQGMESEELLKLLLAGGISTSGTVTEVSGRGIGLDVVRAAAEHLGGVASVRTTAGKGTQVELSVPLSLSLVDVLTLEIAGVFAAIPRDSVLRTLRIAASDIIRTAGGESVVYEGKVIPFMSLSRVLSIGPLPPRGTRPWSLMVVKAAGTIAALGVDRILGTASVVLRPLPPLAPAAAVVIGAWLDADGTPQLVFDPEVLVVEAGRCTTLEPQPDVPRTAVLVIDDSLTTRMLEQSILESAGYDVDTAASAEEGMEKALQNRYALFLVDVEMPGMDGFTFVERIRTDPALREIPAILVTSRAAPEDRRRGEQVGANAYIVKSDFDQGALLARIRGMVG